MKRLIISLFLVNTVCLTACGPLWIKGANKTFGQKKQKSKYSKHRGDVRELNNAKLVRI